MIVQAGVLYYSQVSATGPVSKVALADGGATPSNVSASQPYPMGLAVDPSNVYVWNSGSFSGSTTLNDKDGTLVQLPLAGGAPITLATGIEAAYAAPYLNAVAVNAGHVYWVAGASGTDGAIVDDRERHREPEGRLLQPGVSGGGGDGRGEPLLVQLGHVQRVRQLQQRRDGSSGPIAGGTVTTLASSLSAPAAIAIDSKNVYWTNAGQLGGDNLPAPGTGAVLQVPIGGGTVVTLAKNEAIPLGIAVGNGTVYWAEYTLSAPGRIVSIPNRRRNGRPARRWARQPVRHHGVGPGGVLERLAPDGGRQRQNPVAHAPVGHARRLGASDPGERPRDLAGSRGTKQRPDDGNPIGTRLEARRRVLRPDAPERDHGHAPLRQRDGPLERRDATRRPLARAREDRAHEHGVHSLLARAHDVLVVVRHDGPPQPRPLGHSGRRRLSSKVHAIGLDGARQRDVAVHDEHHAQLSRHRAKPLRPHDTPVTRLLAQLHREVAGGSARAAASMARSIVSSENAASVMSRTRGVRITR